MANSISPGRYPKRQRLLLSTADTFLHQPPTAAETAEQPPLIPGLPDHLAQICLSFLPPSLIYAVSTSWRRLLYSPSFPPFLSLYAVLSSDSDSDSIHFSAYDPISSRWDPLPPPPLHPSFISRHPSFISRHLPIQSLSVAGRLVLLAATTDNLFPALSQPLLFNPTSCAWSSGPHFSTPRRWCAAGTTNGEVYVASGIGSHFSADVAKSVEKWTPQFPCSEWKWEKVQGMKDGRFSRDAIDAVGWRGKLCMVNVKGNAAKEGAVYDVVRDSWEEMPDGMIAGWNGPVAAMDEDDMFVVDEEKGAVRRYDQEKDGWEEVVASPLLRGAQQMAAGGGRVCVVCGDGEEGIVVVDVVARPSRIWVVELPDGFDAVAVHVLPRMSRPEVYVLPVASAD
ncbi:F-box/kelch-repeat protein SKIP25 [Linum perenne]